MDTRRHVDLDERDERLLQEQSRKTGLPVDELIRVVIRQQLGSASHDPQIDDELFDGDL